MTVPRAASHAYWWSRYCHTNGCGLIPFPRSCACSACLLWLFFFLFHLHTHGGAALPKNAVTTQPHSVHSCVITIPFSEALMRPAWIPTTFEVPFCCIPLANLPNHKQSTTKLKRLIWWKHIYALPYISQSGSRLRWSFFAYIIEAKKAVAESMSPLHINLVPSFVSAKCVWQKKNLANNY
jgi:hypothetical protein